MCCEMAVVPGFPPSPKSHVYVSAAESTSAAVPRNVTRSGAAPLDLHVNTEPSNNPRARGGQQGSFVRVVSLTKSRKLPTRNIVPLFV